jgi:hypothetical protein
MSEPPDPGQRQPSYPRQDLLPQQVQPGRSRVPLVVAAVAGVVLVAGVLVALRLAHDSGEHSRAAYCAALRSVTHDGDLSQAFAAASGGTPAELDRVRDLAPSAVRRQWDHLLAAVQQGRSEPSIGDLAALFVDVRVIVDDAQSQCGLKIQIPS